MARLDWHWLAPPPSLDSFAAHPPAVWLPDGADCYGINDRFAIVSRRYRAIYFDRYLKILNGSSFSMLRAAAPRVPPSGPGEFHIEYGGPEWSLRAALAWGRVPVRRFDSTGATLCLNAWRHIRDGKCTEILEEEEDDLANTSFKNIPEALEARTNAALWRLGWSYVYSPYSVWLPPCFVDLEQENPCCNRSYAVAGNGFCWSDFYDYGRCCEREHGLFLLPNASKASFMLAKGEGSICWTVFHKKNLKRCILEQHLKWALA
eukprot:Skav202177  [mRNA]  locus=scaffold3078:39694:40479:- [translate_table: standard]